MITDARAPLPAGFDAILIDPPYSVQDSEHYSAAGGPAVYPTPNSLVANALKSLQPGQRVGIIHYMLPQAKDARFVACVSVICGFNNRMRVYSVFEKK